MATLRDLINALEEQAKAYGDDCEVRLMTQQNYPFENGVHGVTSSVDLTPKKCGRSTSCENCEHSEGCEWCDDYSDDENVVYIVEGEQIKYGEKAAWDTCQTL